jgi:predicted RNase H-like nuclease (RuvC/YqgF family)
MTVVKAREIEVPKEVPDVHTKEIVQIEKSVDNLSFSITKLSDLLAELLARLAVLETRFQSFNTTEDALVIRLEKERIETRAMIEDTKELLVEMEQKLNLVTILNANLSENVKAMRSDFVTKDQFDPIKKIVYGTAGMMLIAVLTAILKLVIGVGN